MLPFLYMLEKPLLPNPSIIGMGEATEAGTVGMRERLFWARSIASKVNLPSIKKAATKKQLMHQFAPFSTSTCGQIRYHQSK